VLDDGRGGNVGPDLRVSGQKLGSDWVRGWLKDPRSHGKIYPWRLSRMPRLAMTANDIEAMTRYLAAMGKRDVEPASAPEEIRRGEVELAKAQALFSKTCSECHTLGEVLPIPEPSQVGPNLINVAGRVDYAWARRWIRNPQAIDPKTKMKVPHFSWGQVELLRDFVWKVSKEHQPVSGREL
jgi:cytochrome c2